VAELCSISALGQDLSGKEEEITCSLQILPAARILMYPRAGCSGTMSFFFPQFAV
jgi:hypothetical protein